MGISSRVLEWTESDLGVAGSLRDVVRAPAGVLSTPGATVDPTSPEVVQLAADLVATMRVSPGCVGLAAPQVGVGVKVFCVDVSEHPRPATTTAPSCSATPRSSPAAATRRPARAACPSPTSPAT